MPLQVVHTKAHAIDAITMCAAMDLIAILQKDFVINIYRSFSWEKVYGISSTILNGIPTCISFSTDGKYLSTGLQNGTIKFINIESHAINASRGQNRNLPIISITWYHQNDYYNTTMTNKTKDIQMQNNQFSDLSLYCGETEESGYFECGSTLIAAQYSDNTLQLYGAHLFPLAQFELTSLQNSHRSGSKDITNTCLHVVNIHLEYLLCTESSRLDKLTILKLKSPIVTNSTTFCSIASSMLSIFDDASIISELCISSLRKWKDILKPIGPKLGLMQSTLQGYNFNMSTIEFLFTISQCGMWHPAASVIFSSQWNEQNLARLRSGVDSTSKYILRSLTVQALTLATNINIKCRNLIELFQELDLEYIQLLTMLHISDALLFKLDEVIQETRLARDNMLLFLDFVKDAMLEASSTVTEETKSASFSLASKVKYCKLFDPRTVRCNMDVNSSTCVAEMLTGTFLYAFLQEGGLPVEASRRVALSHSSQAYKQITPTVQQLLKDAVELARASTDPATTVHTTDSHAAEEQDIDSNLTLLDIVRKLIAAYQDLVPLLPAHLSGSFVSTPLESLPSKYDAMESDTAVEPQYPITSSSSSMVLPSLHIRMNDQSIQLDSAVIHVSAYLRGLLVITELGNKALVAACVNFGADVSRMCGLQIYSKEGNPPSIVGVAQTDELDFVLFKVLIGNLNFVELPLPFNTLNELSSGCASLLSTNIDLPSVYTYLSTIPTINSTTADIEYCPLNIKSFYCLEVCGSRGTACVVEDGVGLCVIDLEAEAEDDEEDDNDDDDNN